MQKQLRRAFYSRSYEQEARDQGCYTVLFYPRIDSKFVQISEFDSDRPLEFNEITTYVGYVDQTLGIIGKLTDLGVKWLCKVEGLKPELAGIFPGGKAEFYGQTPDAASQGMVDMINCNLELDPGSMQAEVCGLTHIQEI